MVQTQASTCRKSPGLATHGVAPGASPSAGPASGNAVRAVWSRKNLLLLVCYPGACQAWLAVLVWWLSFLLAVVARWLARVWEIPHLLFELAECQSRFRNCLLLCELFLAIVGRCVLYRIQLGLGHAAARRL